MFEYFWAKSKSKLAVKRKYPNIVLRFRTRKLAYSLDETIYYWVRGLKTSGPARWGPLNASSDFGTAPNSISPAARFAKTPQAWIALHDCGVQYALQPSPLTTSSKSSSMWGRFTV
jgi:hypothetical protein